MKYRITNQRQLRREFWRSFPGLDRKRSGKQYQTIYGNYYGTDTRCAFVDWIDSLQKDGQISEQLADRATL